MDGPRVFVAGYFNNADNTPGGPPLVDGIAGFNGSVWRNVGTDANGSNGPVGLNSTMSAVRVTGALLYLGGTSQDIGGGSLSDFAAWYRLRQPDGQVGVGASFVGNNIYNLTGASQAKTRTITRGTTGTFTIKISNDGWAADTFKVKGAGSATGFTATYLSGATNITSQVVAGNYTISGLAPGATKTITLKVAVGNSVSLGATAPFLVTATSTGLGAPKDAVKATAKAG